MGIRNVRAALRVDPGKLRPRARIVLVAMAAMTLDDDRGRTRAGTYHGGRSMLLAAIAEYPTTSTYRELKRDIADLIRAGLVVRERSASPEHAAVYVLSLPVDNPDRFGPDPP
jgi:hypothetical protein